MTDSTLVAILASIPATLASLAAFVASLRNASSIKDVHLSINGRMDQLLKSSNAQGRMDEQNQVRIDKSEK
jgi:hypothetical protein